MAKRKKRTRVKRTRTTKSTARTNTVRTSRRREKLSHFGEARAAPFRKGGGRRNLSRKSKPLPS